MVYLADLVPNNSGSTLVLITDNLHWGVSSQSSLHSITIITTLCSLLLLLLRGVMDNPAFLHVLWTELAKQTNENYALKKKVDEQRKKFDEQGQEIHELINEQRNKAYEERKMKPTHDGLFSCCSCLPGDPRQQRLWVSPHN
jgi:hypothetical protein